MIISISGDPGSGKSTIAKRLAEKLGWQRYYIGKLRREAAKQRGMTLAEYNKYGESHPETDKEVDEFQKKLGQEKDNFIIEGRTSWYFIPHSVKLYFKVDPLEGARRVFAELQKKNERNEGENLNSIEDVLKSHQERQKSDDKRYRKYYNINCFDEKNFDFVIDTTNLTPDEVFAKVWDFIQSKAKNS